MIGSLSKSKILSWGVFYTFCICVFFIQACATPSAKNQSIQETRSQKQQSENKSSQGISPEKQDAAGYYFIKALEFMGTESLDSALFYYKQASYLDDSNAFLKEEILKLNLELKKDRDALNVARELVTLKDTSVASTLHLIGQAYFMRTMPDSALFWWKSASEKDPENSRLLWAMSAAYEKMGRYQEMKDTHLKMVRQEEYPDELVKIHIGLLISDSKDSVRLNAFIQELWDKTHQNKWALLKIERLIELKNFLAAEPLIDSVLATDSSDVKALAYKTMVLERKDSIVQMIPYLQKLSEIQPENKEVLRLLVKLELDQNKPELARVYSEKLMKIDGNLLAPDYIYASVLWSMGKKDLKKSLNYVNLGKFKFPAYVGLYKQEIRVLTQLQDFEKAHRIIDTAVVVFKDQDWRETRMKTYFEQIQSSKNDQRVTAKKVDTLIRKAQNIFMPLVQLNKNKEDVLFLGLQLAAFKKDFHQGEYFLSELLKLDSNDHRALNYWGYSLIDEQSQLEKGLAYVEKALLLKPQDPAYLDSKAWYFYNKGDYQQAWKIMESISDEAKEDPDFDLHSAQILVGLKKNAQAQKYWKKLKLAYPYHPALSYIKNKK